MVYNIVLNIGVQGLCSEKLNIMFTKPILYNCLHQLYGVGFFIRKGEKYGEKKYI